MKSKASAPGKVILFGEHFVVYGVKALLCAIDKRVTVTAENINERKIVINSNIGKLELEPNKSITEINSPLKPFYYLANKCIQNNGIKVDVESEILSGVGLGSSSACCVAGAAAISRLFGEKSKEEILELAIEAEKTIFENTSGADCTVCTHGGIMVYDKENGFNKITSEPNFGLVIANSNVEHSTDTVVGEVRKFREENREEFVNLCNSESKLVEEVLELLTTTEDIKRLGEKIQQNQEYLETIGVSNDKLREMVKIGQNASLGSKITGAGRGGCIFSLTDESNMNQAMNQFKENGYECFSVKIDFKGLDTF